MHTKLLSLLAFTSFIAAQSASGSESAAPTPSRGAVIPSDVIFPPCLQSCFNITALAQGCDAIRLPCFCNSDFVTAAVPCVVACSPEDQATAIQFESTICVENDVVSSLASATGRATVQPTSVPTSIANTAHPASAGLSSSAASPNKTNVAVPIAAQSVWVMAAGVISTVIAL